MQVPIPCIPLADEIEALKQERRDWQVELRDASPGAKSRIAAAIRRINALIAAKQPALDTCLAQNGGAISVQPLAVSFVGTVSFVTDRALAGEPYVAPMTWGLIFDGARAQVSTNAFPDINLDTTALADQVAGFWAFLFGPNITTISLKEGGSGAFSKSLGALVMPVKLLFDHSRDVPFIIEDSTLDLSLSTENPGGSRMNSAGQITLSARGTFTAGILNGIGCTVSISGSCAPVP